MSECRCDYDRDYHRDINEGRGRANDPRCHNEPDPTPGVDLCTPCLFGCAP